MKKLDLEAPKKKLGFVAGLLKKAVVEALVYAVENGEVAYNPKTGEISASLKAKKEF